MKTLLTMFMFLGYISYAQTSQQIIDKIKLEDSLKNVSNSVCGCKCKKYIPKNKNKSNSPLFDSSNFQTRFVSGGSFRKSFILFKLQKQDSFKYLKVIVSQSGAFTAIENIEKGQKLSFVFEDSSVYQFFATDILENRNDPDWKYDVFNIVFNDSLKNLLQTKSLKGIWISNQMKTNKIRDRYFESTSINTILYYKNWICCFEENIRKTQD